MTKATQLPAHFPAWAAKLAELYFSGTTSMFVLHGNTFDVVRAGPDNDPRWTGLADFLADQLFGRWDLVMHYDLARGLRCAAGPNSKRLQEMVETANKWLGDLRAAAARSDQGARSRSICMIQKIVMADPDKRIRCAIIIDHVGYVAPSGDNLDLNEQTHLVTLLNWASSPYIKRLNMAFVLIDPRLSSVAERLTGNPHVATIEVPLPTRGRAHRVPRRAGQGDRQRHHDVLRLQRARARQAHRRHRAHRSRGARALGAPRARAGSIARTSRSSRSG